MSTQEQPRPTRDRIHAAARACTHPHLDSKVFTHDNTTTRAFAELMCGPRVGLVHMDVAPTSIVALQHNNIAPTNPADKGERLYTWREWTLALHMSDWTDDVFGYFDGELRDNKLPTLHGTSRGKLELTCYGGVVFCENGAHRLPAAMAWLLSQDERAMLRKAHVSLRMPNEGLVESLLSLVTRRTSDAIAPLRFAQVSPMQHDIHDRLAQQLGQPAQHLVRIERETGSELFAINPSSSTLKAIQTSGRGTAFSNGWPFKVASQPPDKRITEALTWHTIPPTMVLAWSNRDWLYESVRSSEPLADSTPVSNPSGSAAP